jgi:predicted nucleic acid-binding protein
MYLLDTNILLEILLQQEKSSECEHFMNNNLGAIAISDFTLHSIGVILLFVFSRYALSEAIIELTRYSRRHSN